MFVVVSFVIFRARSRQKNIFFIMCLSNIEIIMAETQKRAEFGMFDSSYARAVRLNAILINNMKTYIERKLMEMRRMRPHLSVDIYYDDLAQLRKEQFVVKLHDPFGLNEHFRSNHIRKSLKMALGYLHSLRPV